MKAPGGVKSFFYCLDFLVVALEGGVSHGSLHSLQAGAQRIELSQPPMPVIICDRR